MQAFGDEPASDRVLRLAETSKLVGLSNMQIWRLEQSGLFPRRMKLNPAAGPTGAAGHSFREVMTWLAERRASRETAA